MAKAKLQEPPKETGEGLGAGGDNEPEKCQVIISLKENSIIFLALLSIEVFFPIHGFVVPDVSFHRKYPLKHFE